MPDGLRKLRTDLSLLYVIKQGTLQTAYEWATPELSNLMILGSTSQNTGMPLTDNQRSKKKLQNAERL